MKLIVYEGGQRGQRHTEFPATSNPAELVPGGPPGGSVPKPAKPGPTPNVKMEISSPAKFMFWPEATSLLEPWPGSLPKNRVLPLGIGGLRKRSGGLQCRERWVGGRDLDVLQSPQATASCCVTRGLLRDLSEPQVSQPPVGLPSRLGGRAAWGVA